MASRDPEKGVAGAGSDRSSMRTGTEPDREAQPLLEEHKKSGALMHGLHVFQHAGHDLMHVTHLDQLIDHEENRVINYDAVGLARPWGTFFYVAGTVFSNRNLWSVFAQLALFALLTAVVVAFLVKDPGAVDTQVFATISAFLKVFVAFMLGFFLSKSVARWNGTVSGFLVLVNAVKNLQMQLLALGVEKEKARQVVRYGTLSMGFLIQEFEFGHLNAEEHKKADSARNRERKEAGYLLKDEEERLEHVDDRASLMWIWVACFMSHLAEEGHVPPMSSPTYGRIIGLAQDGQVGIRQVRTSVGVQMPFVYVHLLAVMVHMSNVLCALTLGLTFGVEMAKILGKAGIHTSVHGEAPNAKHADAEGAGHRILIAVLTQGVAPFMYQAFLQIALALSHPFGPDSAFAKIPSDMWLRKLRRDCVQAEAMATNPPSWKVATFKH